MLVSSDDILYTKSYLLVSAHFLLSTYQAACAYYLEFGVLPIFKPGACGPRPVAHAHLVALVRV